VEARPGQWPGLFTLLAALVGGTLGGGLIGVMTYLGWRRRQTERRQGGIARMVGARACT